MKPPKINNIGQISYSRALKLQETEKSRVLSGKSQGKVLLLEHSPPVFTLGRNRNRSNFLVPETLIMHMGIEIHESARGGDITFHEPGQAVAYFILPVKPKSTLDFIAAVFGTTADFIKTVYGVELTYHEKFPGLWHKEAKVCFGGFDLGGGVSSHGISVNVCNDMEGFELINPCGVPGIKVTSLSRILGSGIPCGEFREKFASFLNDRHVY